MLVADNFVVVMRCFVLWYILPCMGGTPHLQCATSAGRSRACAAVLLSFCALPCARISTVQYLVYRCNANSLSLTRNGMSVGNS